MTRYAFLYNPGARAGKSEANVAALAEKISALPNGQLFRSQKKGDITSLIKQQLQKFDVFVACGGDGTVREVASALINTDKKMGIIPMGTGNDFCKTLNIPTDLDAAFQRIKRGRTKAIDVGVCNNSIFLNVHGCGFDGMTNRFADELQHLPSILRYAYGALKATIAHRPFNVEITTDGKSVIKELIMISVANGRVEGGSFWIAPEADLSDGKLELVTIRPVPKWLIPFLLIFFLFKKPSWIPHVNVQKISSTVISFDQVPEMHADGEKFVSDRKELTISLCQNTLEILY